MGMKYSKDPVLFMAMNYAKDPVLLRPLDVILLSRYSKKTSMWKNFLAIIS